MFTDMKLYHIHHTHREHIMLNNTNNYYHIYPVLKHLIFLVTSQILIVTYSANREINSLLTSLLNYSICFINIKKLF